jgi:NAD(P)-dependent dehydrogenase (short-subunit alcohol dehydrogenase family)
MSERVCAIVGIGPGMGTALARRFGREGFRIALVSRTQGSLDEASTVLKGEGIRHSVHLGDAGDRKTMAAVFQRIGQNHAAPEVLIYNAFHRQTGAPTALTEQDLLESLRVNVIGALHCVRQVAPDMRHKRRGTILFTGGGSALDPPQQVAALGVGKAALRNLCFSLAKELAYHDIHVATVTICDHINRGTRFDPDLIADAFWQLHAQPREAWQREVLYE